MQYLWALKSLNVFICLYVSDKGITWRWWWRSSECFRLLCWRRARAEQVTASALLTHIKHTHTRSCMLPVWIITVWFLPTKSRVRLAESVNIFTHHVCAQKCLCTWNETVLKVGRKKKRKKKEKKRRNFWLQLWLICEIQYHLLCCVLALIISSVVIRMQAQKLRAAVWCSENSSCNKSPCNVAWRI